MDVQFLAFSQKEADAFWSTANLFVFLSLFEEYEKGDMSQADLLNTLLREDLEAGSVMRGVEEGKYLYLFLEQLTEAFIPDQARTNGWDGTDYENAPIEYYQTLFRHITEEAIKEKFSDEETASSLIRVYQDLKPVISALDDPERMLYVNVNDELYSLPYFVARAKEHLPIFERLYVKWQAQKPAVRAAQETPEESSEEPSKNQGQLF